MRPEGCEADLLRILASMPFLDRQEMVAVSGWSRAAVYEAVEKLEAAGSCASVLHSADPFPPARRFHLTAAGLSRLADEEDRPLEALLRDRPVSAQWRRNLMERLDALAVIYRMASLLSDVAYPIRFHWYRASPLDAAGREDRRDRQAGAHRRPVGLVSYKLKLSQSYKLELSHLNSKGHHCRRLGGGAWRNAKRWKSERDLRTEGTGLFGPCDSREVGISP